MLRPELSLRRKGLDDEAEVDPNANSPEQGFAASIFPTCRPFVTHHITEETDLCPKLLLADR